MISHCTAALLSIFHILLYVLPFYLSPLTRPSPKLLRDAPEVIRARCQSVLYSVSVSLLITILTLHAWTECSLPSILQQLGLWPTPISVVAKVVLLNTVLFAGPLFEWAVIYREGRIRPMELFHEMSLSLAEWTGWRNFIIGPISEEVLFRSVLVAMHTQVEPSMTSAQMIGLLPLYFGIAHIHHFCEFRLSHPDLPLMPILLRTFFQLCYTTVFGWYATYIFIRTASLPAVVLIHAMCNWIGLPRLFGRVRCVGNLAGAKHSAEDLVKPISRDEDNASFGANSQSGSPMNPHGRDWTIEYYVILSVGALIFWYSISPLTEGLSRSARV